MPKVVGSSLSACFYFFLLISYHVCYIQYVHTVCTLLAAIQKVWLCMPKVLGSNLSVRVCFFFRILAFDHMYGENDDFFRWIMMMNLKSNVSQSKQFFKNIIFVRFWQIIVDDISLDTFLILILLIHSILGLFIFDIFYTFEKNNISLFVYFSIHYDGHGGEKLQKFGQMINNVYKTQIAPQKLDRSLCIPGTFCISIYKDR